MSRAGYYPRQQVRHKVEWQELGHWQVQAVGQRGEVTACGQGLTTWLEVQLLLPQFGDPTSKKSSGTGIGQDSVNFKRL